MTRRRLASAAWTAAVVVAATLALAGIGWFMMRVHEGRWWRAPAPAPDSDDGPAPRTPDTASIPPPANLPTPAPDPPPPPPDAPPSSTAGLVDMLRARSLLIPVLGTPSTSLVPTFEQTRGGTRRHEALDILAPTGTPVVAVEDGTIAKLFTSDAGGLTIYQFDPTRVVAYYYAHLDRYAEGLAEGDRVRGGQVIGYVGATGNADKNAPHLHFAIFKLGPEGRWWEGEPVDPYPVLKP